MALVPSFRSRMKTAASVLALTVLAGCSGVSMPQNTMNLYGADTPEGQRARVDRLVRYCERVSDAGDYSLAMGLCTRAHEIDPSNPLPLALLAANFKAVGENEHAASAYQKILESHPGNVDTYYLLSKHYMDMNDNDRAMSTLIAALEIAPNDPRFHNVIGVLHDKQGNHHMAQFHYREALAIQPSSMSVANNLGLSLALTGDRDEAIALLNRVVTDPNASDVSHHNLALAYASDAKVAIDQDTVELSTGDSASNTGDGDDWAPLAAPTHGPVSEAPLPITPMAMTPVFAAPGDQKPAESEGYAATPIIEPLDERAPAERTAQEPGVPIFNREVVGEVVPGTATTTHHAQDATPRPVSLLEGATAAHNDGVWDIAEDARWESVPRLSHDSPWSKMFLNRVLNSGR